MDLKTLDTVIALITVILVLSLIVQSVQSVTKKWLKLKSKSIQTSLTDLFTFIESKKLAEVDPSTLVTEVTKQFAALGRVSLRKNPMMDSIAKEDLLKILGKIKIIDAQKLDALKGEVDTWFETVMQSFEERYTRNMKSIALCISVAVVILLNANFFDVYRRISSDDALRESVIAKREEVENKLKELAAGTQNGDVTREALNKSIAELKSLKAQAPLFGFAPLQGKDVSDFFGVTGSWQGTSRWERFWYLIKLIGGWAIMVMLLSVGAPFWQDALESLFGIKNLIRKKSDTKNIEDQGGQPKP